MLFERPRFQSLEPTLFPKSSPAVQIFSVLSFFCGVKAFLWPYLRRSLPLKALNRALPTTKYTIRLLIQYRGQMLAAPDLLARDEVVAETPMLTVTAKDESRFVALTCSSAVFCHCKASLTGDGGRFTSSRDTLKTALASVCASCALVSYCCRCCRF